MIALSLIILALSIAAYSISQLQQHGKLKWLKSGVGFWGHDSYIRKYKLRKGSALDLGKGYYRFFKIPYREAFPLSATLLVMFTDGYHLMQFLSHALLSISFGLQFQLNWFDFNGHVQAMVVTWIVVKLCHGICYKIFQR